MEKYSETLHDLTWPELMQQVASIIGRDEKSLESNVNYYMKLFNDNNSDKNQLNKLFESYSSINCATLISLSCL